MVNGRPVVGSFPMVPGIDFAGTVVGQRLRRVVARVTRSCSTVGASASAASAGWRSGPASKRSWLVAQPAGLSARDCMVIGTAGYTAMLMRDPARGAGRDARRRDRCS